MEECGVRDGDRVTMGLKAERCVKLTTRYNPRRGSIQASPRETIPELPLMSGGGEVTRQYRVRHPSGSIMTMDLEGSMTGDELKVYVRGRWSIRKGSFYIKYGRYLVEGDRRLMDFGVGEGAIQELHGRLMGGKTPPGTPHKRVGGGARMDEDEDHSSVQRKLAAGGGFTRKEKEERKTKTTQKTKGGRKKEGEEGGRGGRGSGTDTNAQTKKERCSKEAKGP